jgi:hypothetical protein
MKRKTAIFKILLLKPIFKFFFFIDFKTIYNFDIKIEWLIIMKNKLTNFEISQENLFLHSMHSL